MSVAFRVAIIHTANYRAFTRKKRPSKNALREKTLTFSRGCRLHCVQLLGFFFGWAVSFLSQIREDADVKHTSPPLANAGLFLSLVLLGTRGSPPGLIVAAVFEPGSEPLHIQAVYTRTPRSPTTPRRLCFIFFSLSLLSPLFIFTNTKASPAYSCLAPGVTLLPSPELKRRSDGIQ